MNSSDLGFKANRFMLSDFGLPLWMVSFAASFGNVLQILQLAKQHCHTIHIGHSKCCFPLKTDCEIVRYCN